MPKWTMKTGATPLGATLLQSLLVLSFVCFIALAGVPMMDTDKHSTWEWIGDWTGLLQLLVMHSSPVFAALLVWMRKPVGWWLSLGFDVFTGIVFVVLIGFDLRHEGSFAAYRHALLYDFIAHLVILALIAGTIVLLVLPQSRTFFGISSRSRDSLEPFTPEIGI